MRYVTLPFFTRAELQQVHARCERLDNGCLIYKYPKPRNDSRNHGVYLRGKFWNVLRVMWSETFCLTVDARNELDAHDVGHLAECPNTGSGGEPLCIEPSHLRLVDIDTRIALARERRTAYQGEQQA